MSPARFLQNTKYCITKQAPNTKPPQAMKSTTYTEQTLTEPPIHGSHIEILQMTSRVPYVGLNSKSK